MRSNEGLTSLTKFVDPANWKMATQGVQVELFNWPKVDGHITNWTVLAFSCKMGGVTGDQGHFRCRRTYLFHFGIFSRFQIRHVRLGLSASVSAKLWHIVPWTLVDLIIDINICNVEQKQILVEAEHLDVTWENFCYVISCWSIINHYVNRIRTKPYYYFKYIHNT